MSSGPNGGFDPWHLIHFLWVTLSGIVIWNGKRLFDKLDMKVDRSDLDKLLEDMKTDRRRMHEENRSDNYELRKSVDDLRDQILEVWKNRDDR